MAVFFRLIWVGFPLHTKMNWAHKKNAREKKQEKKVKKCERLKGGHKTTQRGSTIKRSSWIPVETMHCTILLPHCEQSFRRWRIFIYWAPYTTNSEIKYFWNTAELFVWSRGQIKFPGFFFTNRFFSRFRLQ